MVEISAEQRKLAEEYVKKEKDQQDKAVKNQAQLNVCANEADQLIKFLNANGLKKRKTVYTEEVKTA